MSLDSRIRGGVETAFNAVGDVKKSVTLQPKTVSGFDHTTQSNIESAAPPVTRQGIEVSRSISKDGTEEVKLLFRYGDVSENTYQTLTFENRTYTITGFEPTMKYIVEITATKEN
jgi:hypothetical protein